LTDTRETDRCERAVVWVNATHTYIEASQVSNQYKEVSDPLMLPGVLVTDRQCIGYLPPETSSSMALSC
jgi:hypothetical protein